MRISKSTLAGLAVGAALLASTPASALGVADLAKVVLSNGSILKKAQTTCGTKASLTDQDSLAMTLARSAAQKALPAAQFLTIDQVAQTSATTAAKTPTFCNDTVTKKGTLLEQIKTAGKSLISQRLLGGLGGL